MTPERSAAPMASRVSSSAAKPGRLFFTVFEKAHGGLLPNFNNPIRRGYMLDDPVER